MELDALEGQGAVAHAHDDAGLGGRGDLELVGRGRRVDREGVVAGDGQRRGHALEHAAPVVRDDGGLAVHEFGGVGDGAAECLRDGLVAEAYAQ